MVEQAEFSSSLYHPKHWPMWLAVLLMRMSQLLPLSWQMALGKGIGRLVMKFAGKRTHTARRNLSLCFPDMPPAEREQLLVRNFEETGKAIFDTINAWWWSDAKVQQHMEIKGEAYVQDTLAAGQGVILFAVHCLPLEMGARIFGQFQPGVGVYRPHNNPVMEYLQVKGRLRSNKGLVPKRDLRQMVRCLRNPDVI
ncbi:MAG: lipid A biosynthesis lauroyl acyltransferase, partial [Shewanella sp.]